MYSLDTFHPDRLRCDRCGHALPVTLDVWDDPTSLRMLTSEEAAAYFPGLAEDVRAHSYVCPGAWFGIPQEEWEAMAVPG
jgi:hypothetical protein